MGLSGYTSECLPERSGVNQKYLTEDEKPLVQGSMKPIPNFNLMMSKYKFPNVIKQ